MKDELKHFRIMKIFGLVPFLVATLSLFVVGNAGATNWYVDNTATGANNGTSWANAWTSISNISGVAEDDNINVTMSSTVPIIAHYRLK